MRGVGTVRADETFQSIFRGLDALLDRIPAHSSHLLMAEASCLHYLRTLRFARSKARSAFVLRTYTDTKSHTVRRACIDCWRQWKDRGSFTRQRNKWNALAAEEQRMLWLCAGDFGDEGEKFRKQVRQSIHLAWKLGIERQSKPTFASIFENWGGG